MNIHTGCIYIHAHSYTYTHIHACIHIQVTDAPTYDGIPTIMYGITPDKLTMSSQGESFQVSMYVCMYVCMYVWQNT